MEVKDLYRLVRKGEGETLEFKRKVAHPEKIIKEVVAFANTKGGDLLIGVDDSGTIPGVKYADEEIFVLNKALFTLCKPKVQFKYRVIPLDDEGSRAVVHYEIAESKKKPHYALPDLSTDRGKAYVRVLDKSIQASKVVRNILKFSNRKSARVFAIEEEERALLKYLEQHTFITLSEFQKLSKLNKFKASKILVTLVLSNILYIKPSDKEDIFGLVPIVNY
ncbi:ATP-binding protein [Marivirga sp. S37H4]|uniref:ATP-binding protein n=1 Tax=Marivirga aurantiaca TaxID=2802615 RepID=A0A935C8L5_9BACT|nr:ATP-binding protein [Marivirga aurantiaca]MBK6265032.1 ATP-binding protein [Marivirga aurantiaca]